MKLNKLKDELDAKYPKGEFRLGDFYNKGDITIWGGDCSYDNDNMPLFDYYNQSGRAINEELVRIVEKYGFFFECYSPGTYVLSEL